ncbi:unnamed protein product [Spirodela intermedia]|uniref:Uncharacterized protein n=1 Tax=Spirodela intermedia TaxID=51605 RepID=A0A7I8JFW3_SPIIN|nr:unnamed protein product [Spirodela intermedia]CAA6669044.1 unnamed protein product [Spirodela intermedia]
MPAGDGGRRRRGLRCVAGELPRPPANVLGAAAPQQEPAEKIDEGTRGLSFLYYRGSGAGAGAASVAGSLELCTESLGFESCCDGKMGVEEEKTEMEIRRRIEETSCRKAARPSKRRTEAREFPPPLPWLSAGGGKGYLKAVKKDGRLILRASRHGGRLRLELIKPPVPEEEETTGKVAEEDWTLQSRRRPAAPPGGQMRSGGFGRRCQEAVREGLMLPPPPFWGAPRFVTTA